MAGDAGGLAEPAIALAAAPTAEDMLLTASDAATLKLSAAWVLLSACNSVSPDGPRGRGAFGPLPRLLLCGRPGAAGFALERHHRVAARAGNPHAERADRSLSHAEALRRASLAILDDPKMPAGDPFFWAPFTLIGDPDR